MSAFGGTYAKYYDLFYADKDYAGEARFVHEIIRRYVPTARNIVELGCGSGGHALRLAQDGYAVTGIDLSAEMIAIAADRVKLLASNLRRKITFKHADAAQFVLSEPCDAVISLFHVINYQTTNIALEGFFRSARAALKPEGIFIFDFWYGPAVLSRRPQMSVKRIETPDAYVTRIGEPQHDRARNIVNVKYTLLIQNKKSNRTEQATEVHVMRYLFLPEIKMLASVAGLRIVETGQWLTGKRLTGNHWSGYAAASPIVEASGSFRSKQY